MLNQTLEQIGQALSYPYQCLSKQALGRVVTDSRQAGPNDLFVAIVGARSDGHHFIRQALEQGAAAVVISDAAYLPQLANASYLLAEDGVTFIQRLGQYIRQASQAQVTAITGSSGKTTTKDLLSAILAANGPMVATAGNNNNELGLPLTLCRLEEATETAVVEMGMRGLGQIDFLCQLARPNHGIITNIGQVHSELLGSIDNIAKAKAELLAHIPPEGTAVLGVRDRQYLAEYAASCAGRVVWCGLTEGEGDAWASHIATDAAGVSFDFNWQSDQHRVHINLQGLHNVQNAMQALVIARTLAVPWSVIDEALEKPTLSAMRMEQSVSPQGARIYNDAYNANPDSMRAALAVLAEQGPRRIAVLGDMYELGQYEEQSHREIGRCCMALGIEVLLAVGRLGRLIGQGAEERARDGQQIFYAADSREAAGLLQSLLTADDVVLVKGSRGMCMEEIVQIIMG